MREPSWVRRYFIPSLPCSLDGRKHSRRRIKLKEHTLKGILLKVFLKRSPNIIQKHEILTSLIIKLVSPTLISNARSPILSLMPPGYRIKKMGARNALRNKGRSLFLEARVDSPHACLYPLILEPCLLYLLPVLSGIRVFHTLRGNGPRNSSNLHRVR